VFPGAAAASVVVVLKGFVQLQARPDVRVRVRAGSWDCVAAAVGVVLPPVKLNTVAVPCCAVVCCEAQASMSRGSSLQGVMRAGRCQPLVGYGPAEHMPQHTANCTIMRSEIPMTATPLPLERVIQTEMRLCSLQSASVLITNL